MLKTEPISRQRIIDHGEVFTQPREVNAMLDLVAHECERIDSRFLEPACGTGNFLVEVLRRKLAIVTARNAPTQRRRDRRLWERDAILAVTSLYGIDLLPDNVEICRARLYGEFDREYSRLFGPTTDDPTASACRASVRFVLTQNVLCGDALTLTARDGEPIAFPEWAPVNGAMLKRRDFTFHELLGHGAIRDTPLFSDLGEEAFVPEPIRDYPPVHYLALATPDS